MAMRGRLSMIAAAVLIVTATAAGAQDKAREPELNDPGSWAYKGCEQALVAKIQKDRPQAKNIEIQGHVEKERKTDRKSVLSGEARFKNNDDEMRHVEFTCTVDREAKQIEGVDYEKR